MAVVATAVIAASIVEAAAGRPGTWATKVACTMAAEGSMVKAAFTTAAGFTAAKAFTVAAGAFMVAAGGAAPPVKQHSTDRKWDSERSPFFFFTSTQPPPRLQHPPP